MPAVAASLNITSRLLRLSIACAAVFAGGLLASAQSLDPAQRLDPSPLAEVRALWVTRASLTTPAAIEGLVSSARASGFNTLVVQVRGRGDAYFASSLEPRADLLATQRADFDPLRHVIDRASEEGLRVHAWVNVNLVASARGTISHSGRR